MYVACCIYGCPVILRFLYCIFCLVRAAAKAKGSHLRVHFKNTVEVMNAVRGMKLERAKQYMKNVLAHKEAVPFTHFQGGRGRHAQVRTMLATSALRIWLLANCLFATFRISLQAKNMNAPGSLAGWPVSACKLVLNLLENAEANAESKNLDVANLYVQHAQANAAVKGRRRTYRAHGRINPYMRVPSHIELILTEKPEVVAKPADAVQPRLFRAKLAARQRGKVPVGGAK